jgi:8-oxo-dGTP diphosphatase
VSGAAGERWIEVAAAVIERPDGSFLLAQRPAGKVYEGWWEFPGGKVEVGEPVADALARELHEELGIEVVGAYPWITRTFRYPHGNVRLHFYRVTDWRGEPHSREDQALAWQRMPGLTVDPILPANGPILASLALPVTMGITQADALGERVFLERLDAALAGGLRLVQVREHGMSPDARIAFAREVVRRAHAVGAKVVVNGPVGEAIAAGADGVHLASPALRAANARPDVGIVGASCHDPMELDRAESLGLDYAVVGPVLPTASHPGVEGMGWAAFEALARGRAMPVFAIGGLSAIHLHIARSHGAHGIAAIRAAWAHQAIDHGWIRRIEALPSCCVVPPKDSDDGIAR